MDVIIWGARCLMGTAWPAAILVMALWPSVGRAQYLLEDTNDPKRYAPGTVAVPIGYYSSGWGGAGGVAGYCNGLFQPQLQEYEFLLGSSNGSYGGVIGIDSLQLRPVDRLFLDGSFTFFRTERDQNTINGDPRYHNQNAGENKSTENDYVESPSNDFVGDFTFKYLLPIGNGRGPIVNVYRLHDGLLDSGASGGDGFDPFRSGRTFLEVTPGFEYMDIRSPSAPRQQWDTNNLQLSAVYDNRDWPITPARGNLTTLSVTRDFGYLASSNTWTNLSAEFAEYVPLGQSDLFRQEVLALDGWTSYSPTWHQNGRPGDLSISGAPPFYDGAVLGGADKMRGFPQDRFHDRAGIYGCAELRVIPYWDPLREVRAFQSADIAWMQFVGFVEVGRVADEYTFDKLFSQMRADGGVGLRILTHDTAVRFDIAASNEGFQFWANLDQSF